MNQYKDIQITNISTKYGSPETTQLVLKDFLQDKFKKEQLNDKYGLICTISEYHMIKIKTMYIIIMDLYRWLTINYMTIYTSN
jgi:hypothetical protein